MTSVPQRAIPVMMAALALAHAGCDSKSPERTPTGPPAQASGGEGRVSAMAVAPPLGAADPFAVLGASTVTNTGPTIVNGDLGVSPGSAVVGFPPGIVTGTIHAANATSLAAQNAIVTAYNVLAGQPCDVNLTGIDLGGLTLTPGAYCFSSSAFLTGTLTLDAQGNPGAVWVFQIGSTLVTASGSRVVFINGGQSCGAFWQVGSSATFGTATAFAGNVLALASITMTTGATNSGGLFARTGAVTLDTNVVSRVGSCGSGPQPSPTPLPGPSPVPTLPEVAMLGLAALLMATGVFVLGRR
jgi:type VI secretion system secreted protein VgrG